MTTRWNGWLNVSRAISMNSLRIITETLGLFLLAIALLGYLYLIAMVVEGLR